MNEDRREIYQKDLELELLTESRLPAAEWAKQAREAAAAYARRYPEDPDAFDVAMCRMRYAVFSIAEVKRAAKEGWAV